MGQEGEGPLLEIIDWGLLDYEAAWTRQRTLVEKRIAGRAPDRLILVEHPPVVTLGRSTGAADLCLPETAYRPRGVALVKVDRGGKATYHGPGQLVAYPILKLKNRDLHRFVRAMLGVVSDVLRAYGLDPELKTGSPGVWIGAAKVASLGMAVRKWVTYHGIALNVNVDLAPFQWIVPCGHSDEQMTSLAQSLGRSVDMDAVKARFVAAFAETFAYPSADPSPIRKKQTQEDIKCRSPKRRRPRCTPRW